MKRSLPAIFIFIFCLQSYSQIVPDSIILPQPAGLNTVTLRSQNDLEIDASDRIWIALNASGGGVYIYDSSAQAYAIYNSSNTPAFTTDSVRNFFRDSLDNMWISGSSGLIKYDQVNWTNVLPVSGNASGWSNDHLLYATNGSGVAIWDGSQWNYSNMSNSILNNDTIVNLYVAESGNIYISTPNSIYVAHSWNGSSPNWTLVSYPSNLPVNHFAETSDGTLYVTNSAHELYYGKNDILTDYQDDHVNYAFGNSGCTPFDTLHTMCYGMITHAGELISMIMPTTLYLNTGNDSTTLFFNSSGLIDSVISNGIGLKITGLFKGMFVLKGNYLYYKFRSFSDTWKPLLRFDINNIQPQPILLNRSKGEFLSVNEVFTQVNSLPGVLYWDPVTQDMPYHCVPKCEGKNAMQSGGIFIGGKDVNNVIHASGCTYNWGTPYIDFIQGPLDTVTGLPDISSTEYTGPFSGAYSVFRWEIEQFQNAFSSGAIQNGSFKIPARILNWPAQGYGSYTRNLAPWIDYNADGMYNPFDGDYPLIKGDQMIFAVFNDQHPYYTGRSMGIEIHLSAYAYSCPQLSGTPDSVLNYTTFYHYKIINRSDTAYHDVKFANWSSAQLGNGLDDYSGADVLRNTSYVYNGDNDDDNLDWGYGIDPPSIGITFLYAPLSPLNDGKDNDHDGFPDEAGERNGLTSYMWYPGFGTPGDDPFLASEYYNYMNSSWENGQHLTYGGDGTQIGNPPADFMFPGTTDPAFPTNNWTMSTAGFVPTAIRHITATGNSDLLPDSSLEYEYAIVFGRTQPGGGPLGSVQAMLSGVDIIKNMYDNNLFPTCSQVGIAENKNERRTLTVRPNPTSQSLEILFIPQSAKAEVRITDIHGRLIFIQPFSKFINIEYLTSGIYILQLNDGNDVYSAKIVKM